jgi:DNA-binding transcriptional MerR regulator
VTLRQLQWWDENGLISPAMKGGRRVYRAQDLLEILIISELKRKGVSLQKIRWALGHLRRKLGRSSDGRRRDAALYLITDLKTMHLESRPDRVVMLSTKATHPVLVLSVSDQIQRVASEILARSNQQLPLF